MSGERKEDTRTAEGIFQKIEGDIRRGIYQPDELLPSIRDLASEFNVSPATVAAAFRKLADRGLTRVKRGVGTMVRRETFIADSLQLGRTVAPAGSVDVASGAPDALLLPDLNIFLHRIEAPKILYDVEPVIPNLEAHAITFMADILQGRPINLSIASGALDSIADAVGARLRAGDRIIVEDPGFAAAFSLLRSHGLSLVPVPVDDEGFEVDAFAAAIDQGADAVLYSPRAQNPFGSAITKERAHDLREIISHSTKKGKQIFVIENDHASLISDVEYHSLTSGTETWVSTRSLSKSHGPDLRFAFLVGDALTIDRVRRRQSLNRGWISTILQHLVSNLLSDLQVDQEVAFARETYRERRQRLADALESFGIQSRGKSGLNLYLPVEDEGAILLALLARGWQTRSGQTYRHHTQPFIRLTPAALTNNKIDLLAADVAAAFYSGRQVLR